MLKVLVLPGRGCWHTPSGLKDPKLVQSRLQQSVTSTSEDISLGITWSLQSSKRKAKIQGRVTISETKSLHFTKHGGKELLCYRVFQNPYLPWRTLIDSFPHGISNIPRISQPLQVLSKFSRFFAYVLYNCI